MFNVEVLLPCDLSLIAFPFCLLITFLTLSDFVKNSGTPRCPSENQALQVLMGRLEVGSLYCLKWYSGVKEPFSLLSSSSEDELQLTWSAEWLQLGPGSSSSRISQGYVAMYDLGIPLLFCPDWGCTAFTPFIFPLAVNESHLI